MDFRDELNILAADHGVQFMTDIQGHLDRQTYGNNFGLAADAQPALITVSNAGIPAFLANYLDPKLVEVLVSPMKATAIVGEVKKGDWTTLTTQFPIVESTGETSAYGDFSNNGHSSANVNWEGRQSFHFQTITQWGERELALAAEGKIDWAARLNIASALTIKKTQNRMAFFGVAGLANYGLLNDPSLPAPIEPAATGTGSSVLWADKDSAAIYGDIQLLFKQAVSQSGGLVDKDAKMCLSMSNDAATNLTKTNQYNVNVEDQLKKNFPNLRLETAVEYSTTGGELVQLIVEDLEGQKTAEIAFTEKLRAHPVKVGMSSFKQKKSAGGWGAIIYRPFLISGMLGV